jgi:hypothetical protein
LRWLLLRQDTGFNGRPNKLVDTCYSFWVGASLTLLGHYDLVDQDALVAFLRTTESRTIGGFAKQPEAMPDPLHSYMGLAGLAFTTGSTLQRLDPCRSRPGLVVAPLLSHSVVGAAAVARPQHLRSRSAALFYLPRALARSHVQWRWRRRWRRWVEWGGGFNSRLAQNSTALGTARCRCAESQYRSMPGVGVMSTAESSDG